jgi:hypothetical protein
MIKEVVWFGAGMVAMAVAQVVEKAREHLSNMKLIEEWEWDVGTYKYIPKSGNDKIIPDDYIAQFGDLPKDFDNPSIHQVDYLHEEGYRYNELPGFNADAKKRLADKG